VTGVGTARGLERVEAPPGRYEASRVDHEVTIGRQTWRATSWYAPGDRGGEDGVKGGGRRPREGVEVVHPRQGLSPPCPSNKE
jgi:hypothetical protein